MSFSPFEKRKTKESIVFKNNLETPEDVAKKKKKLRVTRATRVRLTTHQKSNKIVPVLRTT
jgi:hypothetical protein